MIHLEPEYLIQSKGKMEQNWRYHTSWFQNILQSNYNQYNMPMTYKHTEVHRTDYKSQKWTHIIWWIDVCANKINLEGEVSSTKVFRKKKTIYSFVEDHN